MKRILCIGNRWQPGDDAGPRVHDRLSAGLLPADVELIDGGLCGLDLARFFAGAERVVVVDSAAGFDPDRELIVLAPEQARQAAPHSYDHGAGLGYLLQALPCLLEDVLPEIYIVAVQGRPSAATIARAAEVARELADHGRSGTPALCALEGQR